MNREDKERYLEEWGDTCFICEVNVSRDNKRLVKSIVPLEKLTDHADPEYIHYYMVCPGCKEDKVLV